MNGGLSNFHADVIQPWGGVRDLRVDGLTGSSNYQGLFLAPDLGPIGQVELQDVNLSQIPGPYDGGGHMLWFTSGVSSCTSYPLSLSNIYVAPRVGRSLGTSVWPQVGSTLPCPGVAGSNGSVSWHQGLSVSGDVNVGPPASGDFVPAGVPGLSYSSPGYGDGSAPPQLPPPTTPSGGTTPPPDASAPAPPPALAPAAPAAPAPAAPVERKVVSRHRVAHKKKHHAKPKHKKHKKKRHHRKSKRKSRKHR
jgi:hypothetical protein